MIRLLKFQRLAVAAACALALGGCATTAVKPPAKLSLEDAMTKATDISKDGNKEEALKLLETASTDYPGDKAPWLQKAQIKFEGGQYGEAILDAQKALARDPTDKVASSIVAISGLRLATTALADLARQNNLSGSLRSESQELAKLLRESIGETILVPAVNKPKPPAEKVVRQPPKPRPPKPAPASSADPFEGLN